MLDEVEFLNQKVKYILINFTVTPLIHSNAINLLQ
ncbi:hypothetical protein CPS_2225 [Colwellia psychrerythraea 34H]|uniref:Uncharacterized protein n=1 Tax=Colwellia psychrerythraea (strain 34H / ATCC BAA-681) TaxID=167879 RepID=Q482R7_COLP3|nr:hypothetical protein CPS_2225 [Colwellia psychrerythraea 34H]